MKEWLEGTVRFDLTPSERSIWADIIIFGGDCRIPGVIQSGDGFPYPHAYLASRFNVPLELFDATLEKLKSQQRILENSDGIHIINWEKYQGAYSPKEEEKAPLPRCPECHMVLSFLTHDGLCPYCWKKGKDVKIPKELFG